MNTSSLIAGIVYTSPAVDILAVSTEGILCTSGNEYGSGIDELPEVDFDWSDN